MKSFFIKFMLIMILMIIFLCPTSAFATFEDVSGHWAEETINTFVKKEYILSGDDSFRPDEEITVGEVSILVNRYFSYGFVETEEENIKIAKENGYLSSEEAGKKISREEIAILICKVLSLETNENEVSFYDSEDISVWSKAYVNTVVNNGIMIGYPNQTYKPKKNITKAEFVTVLNRCIGIGGEDLELIENESNLEIGVFEEISGDRVFSPIKNEISLEIGEKIVLAVKLPENVDEEVVIKIKNKKIVSWDDSLYELTALKKGKTEIEFRIAEELVIINLEVK